MTASIEIRAPSEQTEGTRSQVQRWLKAVGDAVVENEPLIELETDKVTIEIPAPAGGVLAEILKQEQDEIAPGELLGRIQAGAESQASAKAAPAQQAASAPAIDHVTTAALSAHAASLSGGRNSPAVRRLLSEHKARNSNRPRRRCASNRLLRSPPARVDVFRTRRCASASPSGWSRACCTLLRTSRRYSRWT
jgi:pyruvate/2-oxoglutarate dehydrogenase complex dihydrolipoamide acyltransferase (E2) component